MQGENVNDLLANVLTQDGDGDVRRSAATAAKSRPLTEPLAQALASAWKKDPDESVRNSAYAAIQVLEQRYPGLTARMQ